MPIQIISGNFTDEFGVTTEQYKSNAGDEITCVLDVRSMIRISTVGNPLTLDVAQSSVTSPQVNWLEEGFRVGDWVRCIRLTSGGSTISDLFAKIEYVDDTTCDFDNIPSWYNIANGEVMVMYALDYFGIPTPPPANYEEPRRRNDLDVLINHSIGGQNQIGSPSSLIDGENSRCIFYGLNTLNIGDSVQGQFVGNQSGQFFKSCKVTRKPDLPSRFNNYSIEITFVNSGVYNEEWFETIKNLKFFTQLLWSSIPNDPYPRSNTTYDEESNTGWFNQANEFSIANSTLIQGVQEIDYCQPSTHDVVVDGELTNIGIGACYISTNDQYYRNRIENQYSPTMIIPTNDVSGLPLLDSPLNEFNAGYSIKINSLNTSGTQTTINFSFIPNAEFNTFMSDVDDGDRLFYVWIKNGNINHLVFQGQLTCQPPTGGVLNMVNDYGFLDHSQNINYIDESKTGFQANTEDNIAYFGRFLLEKNEIIDGVNVRIEAFNNVTNDDFTLMQSNFNFGGVQVSNDGRYLLDETQNVVTTLPSNSMKRDAELKLDPTLDSGDDYGVSIYYPFLLNWKYWLSQPNANVDFYPNQDKNWDQYDDLNDWELRIVVSVIKNGLSFEHSNVFVDNKYDNDANVKQNIELIIDDTNQTVGIVTIGQLMRVETTHEILNGVWDQTKVIWGEITVEPYESERRYICSTVLSNTNDPNNPLTPLDGVQMNVTFLSPSIAKMECFFDPDVIDLTNGCKFTTKIKQTCIDAPVQIENKTTTTGDDKTTTTGETKTL